LGVFGTLEADYEFEIVEDFLEQYFGTTETMERLISGLKDDASFSENIEELFRIAHNLKSSTGYLKITPINKLVTLLEDVLEECRLVDGVASDELVAWLVEVSDQLALYRDDLEYDAAHFSPTRASIIRLPKRLTQ